LEEVNKLSTAALETLAIIAYNQPITKPQIEMIRGVNCDGVMNTLEARNLVNELGRADTVGHPMRYGVSFEFLQYFGLKSTHELPPVTSLDQLPGDAAQKEALEVPEVLEVLEVRTEVLEVPEVLEVLEVPEGVARLETGNDSNSEDASAVKPDPDDDDENDNDLDDDFEGEDEDNEDDDEDEDDEDEDDEDEDDEDEDDEDDD
jgi:segregation and condensation protein B